MKQMSVLLKLSVSGAGMGLSGWVGGRHTDLQALRILTFVNCGCSLDMETRLGLGGGRGGSKHRLTSELVLAKSQLAWSDF